jgi:hypothetical protein
VDQNGLWRKSQEVNASSKVHSFRVYGKRNQTPASRMGEAWLFREQFFKAKKLKEEQDDWCMLSHHLHQTLGNIAHRHIPHPYPSDPELETLVSILRGQVNVNVHCYEVFLLSDSSLLLDS